ncbi:DUF1553 domain-containing protein [Verrucomicrobiota bacterium sgz303538]
MSISQNFRFMAARPGAYRRSLLLICLWAACTAGTYATPSNRAALDKHYDRFLSKELNRCTTCHLPSSVKNPESLDDFPHNPFGDRLRKLGEELSAAGKPKDISKRLQLLASEDSDGDGVENETEILAGTNPGDAKQTPSASQLADTSNRHEEFKRFLASYRWQPLERVKRPSIPQVKNADWVRTPIDAFVAAEHEQRGLKPRPGASKTVLLRRVYLDLIGLSPTPEEQRAFAEDSSSDAYEKVVDRLLNDPRYGERWGRHWMDIWRYSDWAGWTDGKQIRDSQRHIWRWRDWIIESLNKDKGYDRMVMEMLAADELSPGDPAALRATGFLVRNYKMLSREQWLEDTVKHTSQTFLGITMGCSKCHDHMTDPVSQAEYFQLRAIFEPHQVRIDRVPGEGNIEKDGLARVYDVDTNPATYFFIRGDERKPDKNRVMQPGVPKSLCADKLKAELDLAPVKLPRDAAQPDKRDFVVREITAASEQAIAQAREANAKATADAQTIPELLKQRELELAVAESKHAALLAVLRVEQMEDQGRKDSEEWKQTAIDTLAKQRTAAVNEARLTLHKASAAQTELQRRLDEAAKPADPGSATAPATKKDPTEKLTKDLEAARKKTTEAEQALAKVEEQAKAELTTAYKPREMASYPATSTGRRLAFAKWVANHDNPLTARVAVNHMWLRHFGRGIITTPENFGRSGAQPSHPALLDWLAEELMASGWKMKALHRMIVTSSTYRMASTPDEANAKIDTDNIYLWRMPSRRMEAELVRDNVLYVAGNLDQTMGGPEIDHMQGLASKRRSVYLRLAAEKEVEFLKIFDGPSVNECYQRRPSVMPQQALALANSELSLAQARVLAKQLAGEAAENDEFFIRRAFERVLARPAKPEELTACMAFLRGNAAPQESAVTQISNPSADKGAAIPASSSARARENLILVLFNHNDFVTIR